MKVRINFDGHDLAKVDSLEKKYQKVNLVTPFEQKFELDLSQLPNGPNRIAIVYVCE